MCPTHLWASNAVFAGTLRQVDEKATNSLSEIWSLRGAINRDVPSISPKILTKVLWKKMQRFLMMYLWRCIWLFCNKIKVATDFHIEKLSNFATMFVLINFLKEYLYQRELFFGGVRWKVLEFECFLGHSHSHLRGSGRNVFAAQFCTGPNHLTMWSEIYQGVLERPSFWDSVGHSCVETLVGSLSLVGKAQGKMRSLPCAVPFNPQHYIERDIYQYSLVRPSFCFLLFAFMTR